MMPIKTARFSEFSNLTGILRTRGALASLGALLLISPVGSSFAQISSGQFIYGDSSRRQTVSKNQLLAPHKALHAIERAQKAIIDGHPESAQKEIARAIEIAPHFGVAEAMQGAIDLQAKNYEAAKILFQGAINDDPSLGAAYAGMAVVLIHQRQFESALSLLDRGERLTPGTWFIYFSRAWAQLELGNTEASLKQANLAEQTAGRDSEERSGVSYLRALVSMQMNDMKTAREHLTEAIERDRGGQYAALAKAELERLQPLLAESTGSNR